MCGITGIWRRDANTEGIAQELRASVASLHHRGPNDRGIWTGHGGIGLGHARLSILDLSRHGHQPMVSENHRLVMVFNGEVYNFRAIRRELEPLGHTFKGSGDSEVVLAAFQEWGTDALKRFIGMFAIALWDTRSYRLTLIRDRLGVKPLYYRWDGRTLCFGSELKALRAFSHWTPSIDADALSDYFHLGYINAPLSIYRQVHKLLPGHYLELDLKGEPRTKKYWSVLDEPRDVVASDENALAEQLEALLVDAFKLRMVSDVPVGMFLSGGIDSSLVTALLQNNAGEGVHTFTIGFNEEQYDEAPHAHQIATHLGTKHVERILETKEAAQILPRWGDLYDEPFADSSGIPTYLVSKIASEHVKVVLSADGGDELFSGYTVYTDVLRRVARLKKIPALLRTAVRTTGRFLDLNAMNWATLNAPLPDFIRIGLHKNLTRPASRLYDYISTRTDGEVYDLALSSWGGNELSRLISGTGAPRELADRYPGAFAEKMCLWDLHNYLPGDILAKVDRATMAVSIEGREPLLDHRVVELAFRLPLEMRRGVLGPKHILRRILYKYVPRAMVDRPKKGFGIPIADWLSGPLAELIDQHLGSRRLASEGILDSQLMQRAIQQFRLGDVRAVNRVWTALAFQLWYERWMC